MLDCPYVRRMNRRWPKIVSARSGCHRIGKEEIRVFQIWRKSPAVRGFDPLLITVVVVDCLRGNCWKRTLSISPLTQIGCLPVLSRHNKARLVFSEITTKVSVSSSPHSKQRWPQLNQRAPWPWPGCWGVCPTACGKACLSGSCPHKQHCCCCCCCCCCCWPLCCCCCCHRSGRPRCPSSLQ